MLRLAALRLDMESDEEGEAPVLPMVVKVAGCPVDILENGHCDLPGNTRSIPFKSFFNCSALRSVTMPDRVTVIGGWAFSGTSLTSITLAPSLTEIADYAFSHTRLTSITLPLSVKRIGSWAFNDCCDLMAATIPSTATLGNDVFPEHTVITRVDPPEKPTSSKQYIPPGEAKDIPRWARTAVELLHKKDKSGAKMPISIIVSKLERESFKHNQPIDFTGWCHVLETYQEKDIEEARVVQLQVELRL